MAASPTLKLSPEVTDVLRAGRFDGLLFFLPDRQLDRKLYTDTNKVLDNYGGKWNRAKKAHVFPDDASVAKMNDAIEKGEIFRERVHFQAFYTPEDVALDLVRFAALQGDEETILEPSCGEGALIKAAVHFLPRVRVTGIDINPEAVAKCRKAFPDFVIYNGDSLDSFDNGPVEDVKKVYLGMFDGVLMNPPFQKGQAKRHMMAAFRHLKPGGILAAIMPANYLEGTNDLDKQFRWFMQDKAATAQPVPAGAFKESGTNIATTFVRIVK